MVHVKADATGANNGSSWADAYTDLQTALQNHPGAEIWVAAGVYVPGAERTSTFRIRDQTKLYGGFAGTETLRDERDWVANVTVLSGDIGGDDIATDQGILEDPVNRVGQNAYHVVLFSAGEAADTVISAATVLDGFAVTAGQADGGSWLNDGAGILCYADNLGYDIDCNPVLSNLIVQGNDAARSGGGLAGFANWSGSGHVGLIVRDSVFQGNRAAVGGGASFFTGGEGGSIDVTLENVRFESNRSSQSGGGLSFRGSGDAFYLHEVSALMRDVLLSDNQSASGGGVEVGITTPGTVRIERGRFLRNRAHSVGGNAGDGGGVFQSTSEGHSTLLISDSEFFANQADGSGGALRMDGFDVGLPSLTLTNVSMSGNVSTSGAALSAQGSSIHNTATVILRNSIIWGNVAGDGVQLDMSGGELAASYSLIEGGVAGTGVALDGTNLIDGGGNLDADPRFVSNENLRLRSDSPAIDAGNNVATMSVLDLDGSPRTHDGDRDGTATVDIGAYEFGSGLIFLNGFEASEP